MKTPLTRRIVATVLLATFTLSSCGASSPVASTKDAFVINGESYALSDFEALIADLVDNRQLDVSESGKPSKDDANSVMLTLIRYEAYKQYLAEYGIKEDPADRSNVEQQAAADPQFAELPDYLRELLVNLSVAQATMAKFEAHSPATLKKLYTESPASTGVMCLSHILVKTEDEANAVLKELSAGADFASVAKKKSIEPGADKSGGALANDNEACTEIVSLQQQFDGDFMVGAVAAKTGVPTGPVKTQFGFHIILNRPYDDIKTSLEKVAATRPDASNLAGFMTAVDISVNSEYGVWNGATATLK
jgi:hypothetical protein